MTIAGLEKIRDSSLARWAADESMAPRDVIIQADTPALKMLVKRPTAGPRRKILIPDSHSADRERIVLDLRDAVSRIAKTPPVLLKAAESVAVSATADELRQIVQLPMVKAIYPNRQLRVQPHPTAVNG